MSGKIFGLLCEGHSFSAIAKLLNKSPAAIYKKAKKYEKAGLIERISKYPAQFKKASKILPPIKPVGNFTLLPIILPKKFGASFALTGRPALKYDSWGKAHTANNLYHAQFGRHKAVIWLKSGFTGLTPEEMLYNGERQIRAIAHALAEKYNVRLAFLRIYSDVEWVDADTGRSRKVAEKAGIGKGGAIEVAGAIHKYDDFSDPEHFQINAKPKGKPIKPTEHAIIHNFVYSGEMGRTLEIIGDTMISLNQRLINMEAKK